MQGAQFDNAGKKKRALGLLTVLLCACMTFGFAVSAQAAEESSVDGSAASGGGGSQTGVDSDYTGWDSMGTHWYIDGELAKNQEVCDPETNEWYWFDADGEMARGVHWVEDGQKWVYYDVKTGAMAHGEAYLSYDAAHTGWYYFDKYTGEMMHDVVHVPSDGGKWVYYDHYTGIMAHGEAYLSYDAEHTGWYCFNEKTGAMLHDMQWIQKDRKWVYYDHYTGIMAHGEAYLSYDAEHTGWYYFNDATGAVTYGFKDLGTKTVYYDKYTGKMVYGSVTIDGVAYYFDEYTGAKQDVNVDSDVWSKDETYIESIVARATSIGSETDYFCAVDLPLGRVSVLKKDADGKWALEKAFGARTGRPNDDSDTVGGRPAKGPGWPYKYNTANGDYKIQHRWRAGQSGINEYNDYFVCWLHAGSDDMDDGQGFHYGLEDWPNGPVSGGCVCLNKDQAQWVFYNVPDKTTVSVFY